MLGGCRRRSAVAGIGGPSSRTNSRARAQEALRQTCGFQGNIRRKLLHPHWVHRFIRNPFLRNNPEVCQCMRMHANACKCMTLLPAASSVCLRGRVFYVPDPKRVEANGTEAGLHCDPSYCAALKADLEAWKTNQLEGGLGHVSCSFLCPFASKQLVLQLAVHIQQPPLTLSSTGETFALFLTVSSFFF